MSAFLLRMNDEEHRLLQAKAKKSGISMNNYLLNYVNNGDEIKAVIDAIIVHQNRIADTIQVQIMALKKAEKQG